MTVQVVSMKYTGQQIIADVGEVYQDKESKEEGARPLCLSFTEPYLLVMEDASEEGYNLRFEKWHPFSDETAFKVGFDLVGLIYDPKQAILEAYQQKVQKDAPKIQQTYDPALQPNVPTGYEPDAPTGESPFPEDFVPTEENQVQMFETEEEVNEETAEVV